MKLHTHFKDCLKAIRPNESQQSSMRDAHAELRERLERDSSLRPLLASTFIQGSYRRHTGILGSVDYPCDVDVVVVTKMPTSEYTADKAINLFEPFLSANYAGKYEQQDRSWCIQIDDEVTLDLVPTAEPGRSAMRLIESKALDDGFFPAGINFTDSDDLNEAVMVSSKREAQWDTGDPLWIPNRHRSNWERTHPLFQIKWTAEMNQACDGHFVNVVKLIKWWKRHMQPSPKYPKGYPLEHLVGECCPRGIVSVADGVTLTLEAIRDHYQAEATAGTAPRLPDRALPENDVFHRISGDDFSEFHERVSGAAELARKALDESDASASASLWRCLLGDAFPVPSSGDGGQSGFTPRKGPSKAETKGRFA